jgi:Flp pilus assembly protein TadG
VGERRTEKGDRGSVAVEMVLLAPVLVVLMLFVVYVGRAGGASEQVRHAADQAARAASLVGRSSMPAAAEQAARADLVANGVNCSSSGVSISVVDTTRVDSVTVTVTCQLNTSGTELIGAIGRTITATSTEVIDRFRAG